jgi:3-dehydroquinate synthetase
MKRDKKNREGVLRMVLNKGIGGFQIKDIHEPHAFFSHFF